MIIEEESPVSTQSDLNPKENSLNIYKQVSLWVLAGLFALVFVWRKNYIFFALAIVAFALSFLFDSSNKIATLKAGTNAQLLPTANSSYFYKSKSTEKVEILGKRQDYIKVLFKDGKIGWVNKNDFE